ncbi:MAG: alpha/beta fold hydrolase [Actinomycetota bacterium]
MAESHEEASLEAFVDGLETSSRMRFPDVQRAAYLDNDPAALHAASRAMLAGGAVARDLLAWHVPCLIFVGAGDVDFHDQARRAAEEIPNAKFVSLPEADHLGAHLHHDVVLPAVLRTLRGVRDP